MMRMLLMIMMMMMIMMRRKWRKKKNRRKPGDEDNDSNRMAGRNTGLWIAPTWNSETPPSFDTNLPRTWGPRATRGLVLYENCMRTIANS